MKKRSDAHYPDDDTLVSWAANQTYVEMAERCGIAKSSLRDYLRIRPELKAKIDAVKTPVTVPLELQKEKRALSQKAWKEANRERVREINRNWGKNQSPEARRRWNTYNMNRRRAAGTNLTAEDLWWLDVLRDDPCSFCGSKGGSIDHVRSIISGGLDDVNNLAGACRKDNSSKGSKDLLQFLLWRLENV